MSMGLSGRGKKRPCRCVILVVHTPNITIICYFLQFSNMPFNCSCGPSGSGESEQSARVQYGSGPLKLTRRHGHFLNLTCDMWP